MEKAGINPRKTKNSGIHILRRRVYNFSINETEDKTLKTLEIDEKTLIVTIDALEWERYFPNGEFDISDSKSRISLRTMLHDTCGERPYGRVEVSVLGKKKAARSVFVKYI